MKSISMLDQSQKDASRRPQSSVKREPDQTSTRTSKIAKLMRTPLLTHAQLSVQD
jgi:hypothetical protein